MSKLPNDSWVLLTKSCFLEEASCQQMPQATTVGVNLAEMLANALQKYVIQDSENNIMCEIFRIYDFPPDPCYRMQRHIIATTTKILSNPSCIVTHCSGQKVPQH